jgi:hypothetical protein
VLFPDRYNIRVIQRGAASNNVSKNAVTVSCGEDTGSEGFERHGQEIDLQFIAQVKTTKMGTVPDPLPSTNIFVNWISAISYLRRSAMKGQFLPAAEERGEPQTGAALSFADRGRI